MQYVLCAAGEGSRFQPLLDIPKALIRLKGKTLLEWSLESLPLYAGDKLILITQKRHGLRDKCMSLVAHRYPFLHIEWLEIEKLTRGQLETAYLAKPYLEKNRPITIFNCDTYFQAKALLPKMLDDSIEGIIPCSKEDGESWSFCKVDENFNVLDIREKDRISDWASVGFYFFQSTQTFLEKTEKILESGNDQELYVAPLYSEYIQEGSKVIVVPTDLFRPMGTPEQIETFWQVSPEKLLEENLPKKTLVIDLDNTITIEDPAIPYNKKTPNQPVIKKMREYKANGFDIVIHTARRMRTFKNDEASIVANIADITLNWLKEHKVPFDGLKFGKPYAENAFYIDDRCVRPDEFLKLSEEEILDLLK